MSYSPFFIKIHLSHMSFLCIIFFYLNIFSQSLSETLFQVRWYWISKHIPDKAKYRTHKLSYCKNIPNCFLHSICRSLAIYSPSINVSVEYISYWSLQISCLHDVSPPEKLRHYLHEDKRESFTKNEAEKRRLVLQTRM